MEKITITRKENGYFVEQGDKIAEMLGWDEMLGLIASTTYVEGACQGYWQCKLEDGDFYTLKFWDEDVIWIFIYKDSKKVFIDAYIKYSEMSGINFNDGLRRHHGYNIHRSTEEEKQLLLDKLHEIGKDWNPEMKKVVEYNWKPKDGETYYYCLDPWSTLHYVPCETKFYSNNECDVTRLKSGNCFQIKEQCSAYCDKLNKKNLSNE